MYHLAKIYAHVYVIVKNTIGVRLPGLGRLLRMVKYERIITLKGRIMIRIAIVFAVCFGTPAFAYVDPGSGSAILSAIIGFFVAIGFILKTYWFKFKNLFFGKKPSDK
jgi:hypothetical protein